jgi:hypothetical protein
LQRFLPELPALWFVLTLVFLMIAETKRLTALSHGVLPA